MPVWLAPILWGLVEATVWQTASQIPRIWGHKSDEEVQLEVKRTNKEATRQFRRALENENDRASANALGARGDAMAMEAHAPTDLRDVLSIPPQQEAPSSARMMNPLEGTPQPAAAGIAPVGEGGAPGPSAQLPQMGDTFQSKFAALQQFSGTKLMASKLVGAALARGDQPTEFDYAGIMI